MDLTIEDLRSELEKRGLDSAGDHQDLRSRFEKALQDENEQNKSLETNRTDPSKKSPSKKSPKSEDTTVTDKKKEDQVQEEAMVAIKEGEEDMVRNEADVDEKAENSKVGVKEKAENSEVDEKEKAKNSKVDEKEKAKNSKVDEKEKAKNSKVDEKEKAKNSKVDEKEKAKNSKVDEKEKAENSEVGVKEKAENSEVGVKEKAKNSEVDEKEKAENSEVDEKEKAKNSKVDEKEKAENSKVDEKEKAENSKVDVKEKAENSKVDVKEKAENSKVGVKEKAKNSEVDEKEKAENSEVQSLPPSSAGETGTDEKDSINPALDNTTPQQKTTENDDAAATGDNNSTAETKDSTANPPATKGEENESFIVLVDDTQNDLDADLLAKEKAISKNEGKKSDDASADGSNICPPEDEAKSNEDDGEGDKSNMEVKTDEKKDGKLKSSVPFSQVKSASSANQDGCNLWISGLSSTTKATHLKGIFSKYGKVVGAKVVTNARSPGSRCYGFLTMSSSEEASECIQHLNQTKINNQIVTVKSAKTTPGLQPIKKVKPETKSSEKTDVTKSEEKSPNKKSAEKTVPAKKFKGKPLDKSSEKKIVGKPAEKSDKVEAKKDGKSQSQSEKGDSHLKKSSDKSKMLSPSKTRTPSKTSSHSPRNTRHHRSREHSSDLLERDFQLTLELKQRKTYLEREVRRHEREIDHARLVELELQRRQKEEAFRLERVREELRMEREKLEREQMKLERAEQDKMWKERQQADIYNGFERERHAVKRPYERKTAHDDSFWDEPKRPNLGGSGTSTSRFSRSFTNETWFNDHKDTYDRRGDSYYNRESKPMESGGRFSDSNHGRNNHSPQRAGHERYGPPESSSRLSDHVPSDNRFERREVSSVGYRGHETEHRNVAAERVREIDRRNVSTHERLGRVRNPSVGGSNWKGDSWSHSHGGMDTGHQWVSNHMNPNYERGNGSGVGGSGGFVSGSGSSSSGLAQNLGLGNMYNTIAQPSGMMSGGGGSSLGSRMQEPRFDAYKNMEHGGMRRY